MCAPHFSLLHLPYKASPRGHWEANLPSTNIASVFATIYLFKYLATDDHATDSDKDLARNHISAAHQIFMRYTSSGARSRAAQIIELLGSKEREAALNTAQPRRPRPSLRVKNHFGASLCYDAFLEAEQIRLYLQDADHVSSERLDPEVSAGPAPTTAGGVTATETGGGDGDYFAQIAPLDWHPGWGFPWAIWDNSPYEDAQMGGNSAEVQMDGRQGWLA